MNDFVEWLDANRSANVSEIFHDTVAQFDQLRTTITEQQARIKALEDALDKLAECKRDVERYRWLRHALSDRSNNGKSHHFCSISSEHPEELDEAIDAAIAARGEK